MPPRFDAHSHLPRVGVQEEAVPGRDHRRVVCGTCEADWEAVLAHAAGREHVLPMLGLHPWFAREAAPGWELRLGALLRAHRVGVGECGLDFARKDADRAGQETVFCAQLRLAHELRRPVAMHVVKAWGTLLEVLRSEGVPPAGALVHAFSGSPETARELQAMGVFLSFSGDLLKPERQGARDALQAAAADHLLLETDGTADLERVIEAAASLRSTSVTDLELLTWDNARRCFRELMA
ncbi:TatD family hydrolase [Geothrix fermentans]|uniref:TatD family hydrolase n=1 Tax=Geothrix fermentans TaxID=44676 RepID=UPI0004054FA0|nr:TatD family hydrolase [Geothrix fermentans]